MARISPYITCWDAIVIDIVDSCRILLYAGGGIPHLLCNGCEGIYIDSQ